MLRIESRLRRSDDDVLAKILDGEAVIINLASGIYYSADGVGGLVWNRLEEGLRLADIAAEIAALYDVSAEQARTDVLSFANDLLKEDLVAVTEEGPAVPATPSAAPKLVYAPPRLHMYRDMEELLALDPPTPGLGDLRWKD